MTHIFTLDEANAQLPRVRQLLLELQQARALILAARPDLAPVLQKAGTNGGSRRAGEMLAEFTRFEQALAALQAIGCVLKEVDPGLVDFLHRLPNGREVYLCWRQGEERIEFWHELNSGFAGRQRLV